VQREFPLNDQSRLRLTISKYYTPSGRLIQRPYKGKEIDQYYSTAMDSMHGETVQDTSEERPIYHTSAGRIVYGGGGITPDVVIQYKSGDIAPQLSQKFYQKRLFFEIASGYANSHKILKESFGEYLSSFEVSNTLLKDLKKIAGEKEIDFSDSEFNRNRQFFKTRIKAEIARSIWGNEKFYQVLLLYDNQYYKAVSLFYNLEELLQESGSRDFAEIEK
jgi:carboxyl-terminal processing protease